jgi:hypothetical protein
VVAAQQLARIRIQLKRPCGAVFLRARCADPLGGPAKQLLQVCRERLRSAAVADVEPKPPRGVEYEGSRSVVDRVGAFALARRLAEEDLELLGDRLCLLEVAT